MRNMSLSFLVIISALSSASYANDIHPIVAPSDQDLVLTPAEEGLCAVTFTTEGEALPEEEKHDAFLERMGISKCPSTVIDSSLDGLSEEVLAKALCRPEDGTILCFLPEDMTQEEAKKYPWQGKAKKKSLRKKAKKEKITRNNILVRRKGRGIFDNSSIFPKSRALENVKQALRGRRRANKQDAIEGLLLLSRSATPAAVAIILPEDAMVQN